MRKNNINVLNVAENLKFCTSVLLLQSSQMAMKTTTNGLMVVAWDQSEHANILRLANGLVGG